MLTTMLMIAEKLPHVVQELVVHRNHRHLYSRMAQMIGRVSRNSKRRIVWGLGSGIWREILAKNSASLNSQRSQDADLKIKRRDAATRQSLVTSELISPGCGKSPL